MSMKLTMRLGVRSYDIIIKQGGLSRVGQLINLNRRVLVVSDTGVPEAYLKTVLAQCREGVPVVLPQGEGTKSLECFGQLLTVMLEHGFTRGDAVLALGGGVVGDLAGFAAASYMRGVTFINCPTTTLSQIDSSIGGKTAINLAGTKNTVGAFYQPSLVVADPDTLKSLPERHFINGLAEAVKAGLIADEGLFELFETEDAHEKIEEIVYRSLVMKKNVVERDEREAGLRATLNFGHTLGHAIESANHLGGLYHGECVALGMLPMIEDASLRRRTRAVYKKLGLPSRQKDRAGRRHHRGKGAPPGRMQAGQGSLGGSEGHHRGGRAMSDTYGKSVTLTIFGESHGPAVGATVTGLAPGVPVDMEFMRGQMEKRRAKGKISTSRTEADAVRVLSGVYRGAATGTALTLVIENTNTRSGDYTKTEELLRPGHADYTAHMKYGGHQDARGGGHFSGRLTAPVVAAGSIFTKLLQTKGVAIATHLAQCAGIDDAPFSGDPARLKEQLDALNAADLAVLDPLRARAMTQAIEAAAVEGDSVGGILETVVLGLPAGLGEPFFGSVESTLAALLFSIPAVKGVEFGLGFGFAGLTGSRANDAFRMQGTRVVTATNHNGGVNGGISNGMPLVLRTVVKPTPSIYKVQQTVDFAAKRNATLQISGRHDPCILHRARVVQDSLVAFGLADLCGQHFGTAWQEGAAWNMD